MSRIDSFNANKITNSRLFEKVNTNKSDEFELGWIPAGRIVNIKGYEINGMVYVGIPPNITNYNTNNVELSKAYIDPSKNVSRTQSNNQGEFVPFAPSYSKIDSASRASYLDWLARGKADTSYSPSYFLMYFFGLERRYMLDNPPDEEKKLIVQEVKRILEIMPKRKLKPYLNHFLSFIGITQNTRTYCEDFTDEVEGNLPFNLKAELGCVLAEEGRFTSSQMLEWFLNHNESRIGEAAERYPNEFCELFQAKLDKRKPNGIKIALHPNQKIAPLVIEYYATSEEFVHNVGLKHKSNQVPDISEFKEPHNFVQKLADEVESSLSNYCQYSNANRNSKNKVEAISLLPISLRKTRTIKGLRKYLNWANQVISDGGVTTAGEAIALVEGKKSTTIYREQWEKTTNLFALAGYGLAPDTSLFYRPVRSSIPAILFNLEEKEKFSRVNSDQYWFALTTIALGSYILHASGENLQKKREVYKEKFSEIHGLTEHEQKCLSANFKYLSEVPPDQSFFQRIRIEVQEDQKLKFRRIVVDLAKVAGTFKTNIVSAVETFYEALKIDRQFAYSDLHAGEVVVPTDIAKLPSSEEPSPQGLSTIWTETNQLDTSNQASQGQGITQVESNNQESEQLDITQVKVDKPESEQKVTSHVDVTNNGSERQEVAQINATNIESEQKDPASIERAESVIEPKVSTQVDTNKMTEVLSNLYSNKADSSGTLAQPKKINLVGLDERHTNIVKLLLEHRFWPESKFMDMVKGQGLMPVNVVKKLNEWAYHEYNGPLIEVNNGYHVESQLARILKSEIQKGI